MMFWGLVDNPLLEWTVASVVLVGVLWASPDVIGAIKWSARAVHLRARLRAEEASAALADRRARGAQLDASRAARTSRSVESPFRPEPDQTRTRNGDRSWLDP